MKVYVAGPMMGRDKMNEPAFREAAKELKKLGHDPVVPHDIPPWKHEDDCPPGYSSNDGHSSSCYLKADFLELLTCDAIYLLKDWYNSKGATCEYQLAMMVSLHILFEEEEA